MQKLILWRCITCLAQVSHFTVAACDTGGLWHCFFSLLFSTSVMCFSYSCLLWTLGLCSAVQFFNVDANYYYYYIYYMP